MDPLRIIYEDDSIIVCHKPAGLATQTRQVGREDLESQLRKYRISQGEKPEIFLIHRLDQPVEGVMVFAKDSSSAASLSKQVNDHSISKHYYAIVSNLDFPDEGELVDYLVKDAKSNTARVVSKNDPKGKQAKLVYKTIDSFDGKKLLDIELYTGRHHQIRVQLASRNAPILGDVKYGGQESENTISLCSYRLAFKHPKTHKNLEFTISPNGKAFKGSKLFD